MLQMRQSGKYFRLYHEIQFCSSFDWPIYILFIFGSYKWGKLQKWANLFVGTFNVLSFWFCYAMVSNDDKQKLLQDI